MQPESAAFLWDVRAAGVRITTFADGLTAASYAADELRKSAVERQLEIIGEALNRLRKADPETATYSRHLKDHRPAQHPRPRLCRRRRRRRLERSL